VTRVRSHGGRVLKLGLEDAGIALQQPTQFDPSSPAIFREASRIATALAAVVGNGDISHDGGESRELFLCSVDVVTAAARCSKRRQVAMRMPL
jgi:hypothetical protein